jgi:hypothetical protein
MLRWLVRLVRVPPANDPGDTLVEFEEWPAAGPLRPGLSILCQQLPGPEPWPARGDSNTQPAA